MEESRTAETTAAESRTEDRAESRTENRTEETGMLYTGRVETQGGALNVRQTPGGSVIGQIERGQQVEVLGDTGKWLAIAYGGGLGYAAKEYIVFEGSAQKGARMVIEDEAGRTFIPEGGYTVRLAEGPID